MLLGMTKLEALSALMPPRARPRFASAKEFALWALNADEYEVAMDQKIKLAVALLAAEAKQAAPQQAAPLPDRFRPRA